MQTNARPFHLTFPTFFGTAGIIYYEKPFSMIRILLPRSTKKSLVDMSNREYPRVRQASQTNSHPKANSISESVIAYFKGNPVHIPWKWMDMGNLTELQRSVLTEVACIPYGKTKTYKEIAEAINRPGASRFVGNTMAKNPFPVLIPCHRVIRSDGSVGRFGGGSAMKKKMIELEVKRNS